MNWSIVHLKMVNMLVSVKLFQAQWPGRKVLIKCDNEAVVTVLRSGKARDPFLGPVPGTYGVSVLCKIWIFSMCTSEGWTTGG